ncbi:MAG: prolyl oligopeptidase family serine peptidase, partial [Bacteroidetes bacterium]|nr:prolyl oligopeptidase family serine peptidase [Bacteroidota bacterium]
MITSLPAQTWQNPFQKVEIPSSIDQNRQPAWFYRALGEAPRPLVVSLHTWSGDYNQEDTLAQMCIEKNYHYIHPNFRGQNNRPEACGSELAIQDIDDAIAYALENAYVDSNEIHITGTSGGGYATLLMYMKTRFPVKTFAAWVPISDIGKWYYESKGRGNKYALEIAKATNPGREMNNENHSLGKEEAHKRSPMYMSTPTEKRQESKLFVY